VQNPGAVNADLQFQDEVVRLSGLRRAERTFCQLSNIVRMFISSLEVTYDLRSIYDDVDGLREAAVRAFESLDLADRPRPGFVAKYARAQISAALADDVLALARRGT